METSTLRFSVYTRCCV